MNPYDMLKALRRANRAEQQVLRKRGGFHGKNSRAYARHTKHKGQTNED